MQPVMNAVIYSSVSWYIALNMLISGFPFNFMSNGINYVMMRLTIIEWYFDETNKTCKWIIITCIEGKHKYQVIRRRRLSYVFIVVGGIDQLV